MGPAALAGATNLGFEKIAPSGELPPSFSCQSRIGRRLRLACATGAEVWVMP